jgi:hypothetical protein
MTNKIRYKCEACGEYVEIVNGEMNMPECCEKPMTKIDYLDFCEKPSNAEHARLLDNDEPCDDGRFGKI